MRPSGELIDVGGHRLHLYGLGSGAPTVVFDAALGGSSLGWVYAQRGVAAFARAYSYDRAGMGWSAAGPLPRALPRLAEELRALLRAARAPAPYVLVGHSFGGLVARWFAAQYPVDTAGLVLVDAPSPREWAAPSELNRAKLDAGIRLARRGALAARCGVARFASLLFACGALRAAQSCAALVSGGRLRRRGDFSFSPVALLPDDLKPAIREFWTQAKFYDALASQLECLPEAARLVLGAEGCGPEALGDLPLRVLTAADAGPARCAEQARAAAQSRRGRHYLARRGGHWIPLEDPELVIAAVREVVELALRGAE